MCSVYYEEIELFMRLVALQLCAETFSQFDWINTILYLVFAVRIANHSNRLSAFVSKQFEQNQSIENGMMQQRVSYFIC